MRNALYFAGLLVVLLPPVMFGQGQVNMEVMQKLKDEEKHRSQVQFIAHNLTDVIGPRLTNSPGYRKAVEWTVKILKEWGLKNAAPEPWGEFGKGWSMEESYIAMKKPYFQPLIGYPVAWSGSTNNAVSAKLVLLDKLDSATITKMGEGLRGKIVMVKIEDTVIRSAFTAYAKRYADTVVLNNLPDKYIFTREMLDYYSPLIIKNYKTKLYLQSKGGIAILTVNNLGRDGTIFVAGTDTFAKDYLPTLPEIVVSTEDYLRLMRLLQGKIEVEVAMNIKNKFNTADMTGYNVIAEIPGSDPLLKNEVVILGAHLDSWHSGTGATDNAAGCIVAMEAVRLLKALGLQPKRTIRIALWGGEEQGLLGSFGYVKKHYGNPLDMKLKPAQKNVSAYFNIDNGSGKIRGIYLQNNEKVRDLFTSWFKPFADMGATGVTSSNTGSTDHLSFDAVGIPGFQFIQDPLEYDTRTHHSNMDVYDHLSIDDLKQAATIMAAFVYNAAMLDEKLPRKPLPRPERFVFDADLPL